MEFDVYDRETEQYLSTERRHELLLHTSDAWSILCPVRVLAQRKFDSLEELESLIGPSAFFSGEREVRHHTFIYEARKAGVLREDSLLPNEDEYHLLRKADWDPRMEGLYIK